MTSAGAAAIEEEPRYGWVVVWATFAALAVIFGYQLPLFVALGSVAASRGRNTFLLAAGFLATFVSLIGFHMRVHWTGLTPCAIASRTGDRAAWSSAAGVSVTLAPANMRALAPALTCVPLQLLAL